MITFMSRYDSDIGWMNSKGMTLCRCGHREKSHRPMSRKCSLCGCPQFDLQHASAPEEKKSAS